MRHAHWAFCTACLLVASALGLWASGADAKGNEEKVELCHVPPGNPDNPQTLRVGRQALDAHLKNHPGDSAGPCPQPCLCDDGNPCTNDACNDAGECVSTPKDCEDGNVCTKNACDPATGECTSVPDMEGLPCNDEVLCTGPDQCVGGVCKGEPIENCCRNDTDCETDGRLCTIDTCNEATGECAQEDFPCGGDACAPEFCVETPEGPACEGTPVVCNSTDPCLAGRCTLTPGGEAECVFDPVEGCQNCEFEWVLTEECGEDAVKTETLFIDQFPSGDGTACPGEDGETRTVSCCICRDKTMPLLCGL